MRNFLLIFLFLCLYAATSLATEVWFQPLTEDEQIIFASLNAKRLAQGLNALTLDGFLTNQAHRGEGSVFSGTSLDQVVAGASEAVLSPNVERLGLAVTRAQSQITAVVATK